MSTSAWGWCLFVHNPGNVKNLSKVFKLPNNILSPLDFENVSQGGHMEYPCLKSVCPRAGLACVSAHVLSFILCVAYVLSYRVSVLWLIVQEGKDIVARARTGSGKTLAYLLPLLQKCMGNQKAAVPGLSALVLVPTRELCQQVHSEVTTLLEHCGGSWKAVQLTSSMSASSLVRSFKIWFPFVLS